MSSTTSLIDRLIKVDRETPNRVLVVGDVMTDEYIYGRLENCQDGCTKFMEENSVDIPGGAANAARSLKHWFTEKIIIPNNHWDGPVKTRFIVDNKCIFRHDDDRCYFDFILARREVLSMIDMWCPGGVLISDYDKGLLTPQFICDVVLLCASRNIICVADVKREPSTYCGTIIKGNTDWYDQYGVISNAVITRGADRPLVGGIEVGSELPPVPCVSYVGAGDCFVAHLTLAMIYGFSLEEAATIAHSAGRVYVQYRHNSPPHPDEIRDDMGSCT